mmetsp:Transcript_58759/g.136712  ORF Transcript_58759/g.136712 Transcript_58759/m.136712 type:complete len:204 (+) Transcript_58759:207-818(+)
MWSRLMLRTATGRSTQSLSCGTGMPWRLEFVLPVQPSPTRSNISPTEAVATFWLLRPMSCTFSESVRKERHQISAGMLPCAFAVVLCRGTTSSARWNWQGCFMMSSPACRGHLDVPRSRQRSVFKLPLPSKRLCCGCCLGKLREAGWYAAVRTVLCEELSEGLSWGGECLCGGSENSSSTSIEPSRGPSSIPAAMEMQLWRNS